MPQYIPFVRVSTKQQETARQLTDISNYASSQGWQLAAPVEEVISGGKKNRERPALDELHKRARRGDTVIATEISRLGRDTAQVLALIEELSERGVCVFVLNHRLATLRADGSRDAMAQAMLTFGAEFARLERVTLRERVQSGVDYAASQGRVGGRPVGATKEDEQLLRDHADIVARLLDKQSIRDTAALTKKADKTVSKVRKVLVKMGRMPGAISPGATVAD
jgi:DNA invertase Pin-like site-specific DNA recombinase